MAHKAPVRPEISFAQHCKEFRSIEFRWRDADSHGISSRCAVTVIGALDRRRSAASRYETVFDDLAVLAEAAPRNSWSIADQAGTQMICVNAALSYDMQRASSAHLMQQYRGFGRRACSSGSS